MKAKFWKSDAFNQKRPNYTFEDTKHLLKEALESISFWQEELANEKSKTAMLEQELRILKSRIELFNQLPKGSVRLPMGGVVK